MELSKYDIHVAIVYFEELKQYKARPVLIFDNDNKYAVCDIFSITSKNKQYKYNYKIEKWKEAGLKQPSFIKLAELKSLNKDLIKDKIGTLQKDDIEGLQKVLEVLESDRKKASEKYNNNNKNKIEIPEEIKKQLKFAESQTEDQNEEPPKLKP